ncbi:MAG: hypothetical protein AAF984_05570 [Verrucomicrobiota bacterium]
MIETSTLQKIFELEGVECCLALDHDNKVVFEADVSNRLERIRPSLMEYLKGVFASFEKQNLPLNLMAFEFEQGSIVIGRHELGILIVLVSLDVSVPFIMRSVYITLFHHGSLVEITDEADLEEENVPANQQLPVEKDLQVSREAALNAAVILPHKFWLSLDTFLTDQLGDAMARDSLHNALKEIGCTREEIKTKDFDRLIELLSQTVKPDSKREAFKEEFQHLLFNIEL